ncbi:hypothetical protein HH308_21040 [Gordonia sp. TBRC 11910]|uniref:DUF4440 domain-containing protein n=1 Tax=Gordonia asplenii TaxID=2725283 RepID=A0A848KYN7_9ACTN|nr:hypothetical protein [Gordonia asplenii]NMO03706.1 hypothetical protein [Gordonia asplenii]
MSATDLDEFTQLYERHVGFVRTGDMRSALADMAPDRLPTVFDGVDVPRSPVERAEIVNVYADGDRRVGEAVYHLASGPLGLRSTWELREGRWLATGLENFSPDPGSASTSPGTGAPS